jgi:hypothetical protein
MAGLGIIALLVALPRLLVDGLVRVQDHHPLGATAPRLDHVADVLQCVLHHPEGDLRLECIDGRHVVRHISDEHLLIPLGEGLPAGNRHLGQEIEREASHLNPLSIDYPPRGVLWREATFHQPCGPVQTAEDLRLPLGSIAQVDNDHPASEQEAQVRAILTSRRRTIISRRNVERWMASLLTTPMLVRQCVMSKWSPNSGLFHTGLKEGLLQSRKALEILRIMYRQSCVLRPSLRMSKWQMALQ